MKLTTFGAGSAPASSARIRGWLGLSMAFSLLTGCGQQPSAAVQREPLAMPTISQVLPSNVMDQSCPCLLRNQCAMVADALPGHFEGRDLQCRVENEAARLVRCRFEVRFVTEWQARRPTPGAWAWHEGVYHNIAPGAWCAGTPS